MVRYRFFSVLLFIGVLFSLSALPASAQTFCDWAQYVSDVSVPDGTPFTTGAAFTKTWRLMNAGTCTWTTSYKLVFASGDPLGAPASVNLPVQVAPGETVDISVNMTAPTAAGHYKGFWKLSNEAGTVFGIGSSATDAFWVDINVVEINTAIYDFVANAPYAQWKSAAGTLPYPGTSGDSRGYSFQLNNPRLEDNSLDTMPGLLVVPHNRFDGTIQAVYPEFLVQQGDRFQTTVGCEYGATSCYVTFRLDYLTSTGSQRTVWTWKEAYEGRFYRANIDLSRLAGQRVRFTLTLLSAGSASGDRAIWGAPRIIRAGSVEPPVPPATLTPLPGLTPTPTPFSTPPPLSPAACERVSFVADITVPDGTLFTPGAGFTKTWRLRNSGSCAWTTAFNLVFYSGSQMDAPTVLRMPRIVSPGQTVDLAVNMVAPQTEGIYRGHWVLQNANGGLFGMGRDGMMPFWVQIHVVGEAPVNTGYDFVKNACAAQWRSGAGQLACPSMDGNLGGFVIPLTAPKLEDGSTGTPGLLIAPHFKWNGFIQGFYPTFTVQPGDRFQTSVGCEYTVSCYAAFRLDYMTASGSISTFWTWREQNERRFYNADIDLSPLAGRSVRFILTVLSDGSPVGDRVVWGAPQIVRVNAPPNLPPSPTFTPTPTATPPADNWQTFTNAKYGFQFKYPPEGQKETGSNDNFARIRLPFAPGTNLGEKYLDVNVAENVTTCRSPVAASSITKTSETVSINGLTFLKETGGDVGVGNIWEWIAYSTAQGTTCVSLSLVLHSTYPGNSATPPPVFDKVAESAVINTIVSTFSWPTMPPTSNWLTYTNSKYGFQFKYPPEGQKETGSNDNFARIRLPFAPGTNLGEKYLDVNVAENVTVCRSPVAASSMTSTSESVIINGLTFLKETGGDAGAGQIYEWIAYSTAQGTTCVSLSLVLHSTHPGTSTTPPPVFDKAAESAVINNIVSTFSWPTMPPTSNWLTYTNSKYGLQLKYPPEGQITAQEDNHARITLPFVAGTNLREKYLDIVVAENTTTCRGPHANNPMNTQETVTINGQTFLKETGEEGAAGNYYNWITYSIAQGSTCVSLDFFLHSLNAGNFETPPPVFDMAAETAVFQTMISTFSWPPMSPTNNWLTYTNMKYGFKFMYPPQGQVSEQEDNHARIDLPFVAGTNLREKYLDLIVVENVTTCQSPLATFSILETSENVNLNGLTFLKQTGGDRGVGHIHQWVAFSIAQGSTCISMDFILHSTNPDNYPTPPPVFDMAAESAVFQNMVSTFAWVPPTGTPESVLSAAVAALNSKNFNAAKALMDQSFGFAFWQSQGTSYTPDLAIQQLQNGYIGPNTNLVPDANKDLVTLLGGSNPYAVMGLDAAKSQALFVSGWGLDGKGEAILYVTRRADNSVYWHSVLIAPAGFIPQTSLQGPYGVTLVARNDVLNIRSAAGASNPIVGSFAWDATNVMRTGETTQVDNAFWSEVLRPDGGNGWVNFNYLTEYITSAAFCADTRVPSRIDQLKQAITQSNGNLFASLVGQKHGVAIGFWRDASPVNYTTVTAQTIFTDATVQNWGTGPAAGPEPVTGTFAQIVQPDMTGVFNSNYLLVCDNPSYAGMFPNAWPYTNIHYYAVVKPPTTNIDFDWKVWLIGFEYLAGQPYLFGTIHYVWEP